MMILRELALAVALSQADGLAWAGGEAEELRSQAVLFGSARDPEALEDLRRRLPAWREDEALSENQQEQEKQDPPAPAPRNAKQEETPSVDFTWLELYPRVGMA